jgi:hypothetical protein
MKPDPTMPVYVAPTQEKKILFQGRFFKIGLNSRRSTNNFWKTIDFCLNKTWISISLEYLVRSLHTKSIKSIWSV